MSIVQDDLYNELCHKYDHDTATALIGAVREEIAHDLAEKQRDFIGSEEYVSDDWEAAYAVADLIDPEVE